MPLWLLWTDVSLWQQIFGYWWNFLAQSISFPPPLLLASRFREQHRGSSASISPHPQHTVTQTLSPSLWIFCTIFLFSSSLAPYSASYFQCIHCLSLCVSKLSQPCLNLSLSNTHFEPFWHSHWKKLAIFSFLSYPQPTLKTSIFVT